MHGKGTIIEGNTVTDCRGGIIVRPYHTVDTEKLPSGLKIINNFIELSVGTTGSCFNFYIVGTHDISDILIQGNTFANGYYDQTSQIKASLAIVSGSSENNGIKFLRVIDNVIKSGRGAVSYLKGIHNSLFKNNKFISESLTGVSSAFSSAINANYVTDTIFEGNEFMDTKETPTLARIIQLNTGTSNLTIKDNNIINYTSNIYLDYDTDAKLIYKNNNRRNYLPLAGTFANKPAAYAQEYGVQYYNTDQQRPMWWSGVRWKDADGIYIVTTTSDINTPNKIYKITTDIDLQGATITIPANCTLNFQGGSFSNGTIVFSLTNLINPKFSSCRFKGSIINQQLNVDDFGAKKSDETFDNSIIINDLINLKKRDAYAGAKTIFIPSGAYYIANSIQLYDYYNSNITLKGEGLSSVISQVTDNIPIIKSYETTVISDLRLIYKNWQPVENTNATAIAVQRAIRSTFENLQIVNAQKGFGYITIADQEADAITSFKDQTYVNANTRNVGIYQCSSYAIDLRKEIAQADSGSTYDNIYISSSHPINGYDSTKPSVGAIYMGGSSMAFTQLNIESKYSGTLIMSTSLTNYLSIAVLHIEGMTDSMRTIYNQVAGQGFFDIGQIDIDRCHFALNDMYLFYFTAAVKFNIDIITLRSSCTITEGNRYYIFQQDAGTSYGRLGNHTYPAGMAPTRVNNSYNHIVLRIDRSDFLVTYGSQDEFTTPSKNNWLLYAGSNTIAYLYNKAIYVDDAGDYRYPDGYLARYNDATIRRDGTTEQRPILDNNFIGFKYYDTTLQKYIMWNGTVWRNLDGTALLATKGTTAERPTITVNGWGYQYYDNDLKKPIWWDGTNWKDAAGTVV